MGWAETQATYRFYSNESVTWEKLLTAHTDQVERRIIKSEEAVILCLQDTAELDFNGQETEGLGRLSYDAQRGMYLHPTLCITPERVAEMAERCPQSRLVYVADREGDILSLMAKSKALNTPADWLVRERHNRKLSDKDPQHTPELHLSMHYHYRQ